MNNTSDQNKELMLVINHCAELLLEASVETLPSAMVQGMKMIGKIVDVDRVSVWQNHRLDDGKLYYKLVCEWAAEGLMKLDSETVFSYEEMLPYWEVMFTKGESINCPIDQLPQPERSELEVFGLQSLLAVPISHKGQFWGYVGFDDYRNRRFFEEEYASILHSWGLLVVGAIQRY